MASTTSAQGIEFILRSRSSTLWQLEISSPGATFMPTAKRKKGATGTVGQNMFTPHGAMLLRPAAPSTSTAGYTASAHSGLIDHVDVDGFPSGTSA